MNRMMNRQEFTLLATLGFSSTFIGKLHSAEELNVSKTAPGRKSLIELGINALARAHSMNYFMDGHRGAALVSAHLMCEENNLSEETRTRIAQLFDLTWAATPLCSTFPEEDPDPSLVKKIGEALMEARGSLREVGHNAIFAMHAVRGLRVMPELATPRRIDGICKLIRMIKPWRDDVEPAEDIQPPAFKDKSAASAFILHEASSAIDRWTGRGQGFSGHMLTFGQALVEFAAMGDGDWAESCRDAFRKYVTITRKGPQATDKGIAEHKPTELRPNDASYWKQRSSKSLGIGHVFKYRYSYYNLMRNIEDPALQRELDEKAWRVF